MGNGQVSSGVVAFKQMLVTAGLWYLLLPNLLFLLGWVQPYIAIPVSILLIGATIYVCRKLKSGDGFTLSCKPFTISDWILLFLTLAGMLFLTDLIGFHANIPQDPDFSFRNAIYATLVCEDWPIYSLRGEYFIYYHAFWLPPALLTKLCGEWLSPHTALYWWSYLGLALAGMIFFIVLRKGIVLFAVLLCGTLSLSYAASALAYLYDSGRELTFLNGQNHFYLTNFWLNQLRCTFNHAVPTAVFLSIILCKGVSFRYLALPSACLFGLSPMAAVAALPLLGILVYREWRVNKVLPFNTPMVICCVLVGLTLLYLGGQTGEDNASLQLLWNDSPFWAEKTAQFTHTDFRLRHAVALCLSFLLPLLLFLDKNRCFSLYFLALVITTIFISFVWIGRENNELLFKGSLILAFLQALLLVKQWESASRYRNTGIVLLLLLSMVALFFSNVPALLHQYTFDHHGRSEYRTNSWEWSLNHPDDKLYMNFFGTNRNPFIFYDHQGQSKGILPINACDKKVFSGK